MADNKLELVIEVDPKTANAGIKSINRNLSDMEKQAVSSAKGAAGGMDSMARSMTKGVIAGSALYDMAKKALGMLKSFTLGAIEAQDNMGKMAQKVGLSVEELSSYSHAAKLADVDMETLGTGIGILSRNMLAAAQGSKEQRKQFAAMHIEYRNADKTLRATGSVLEDLADRFAGMPDGAAKTARAMQLLGRSGKELIPLLNAGGEGLRQMRDEAEKLGLVISNDTAKSAENFNDNLTRLKAGIEFSQDFCLFGSALQLFPKILDLFIFSPEDHTKGGNAGGSQAPGIHEGCGIEAMHG